METLGQKRVRIGSQKPITDHETDVIAIIKQKTAELIDLLQSVRNDEVSKTYEKTPENKQDLSGERLRVISTAQTKYEEACMWAVKSVTGWD